MLKSLEHKGMLKVFIADSSKLSCQLIAAELRRGRYRVRVVGSAIDADGIREGLDKVGADVVVIGARLAEGALVGFDVTREVRASHAESSVIMILDSSEATMVVEAFRAGASGIFCRDQSSELLCKGIRAVHRGEVWANSGELHFLIDALSPSLPALSIHLKKSNSLLTKGEVWASSEELHSLTHALSPTLPAQSIHLKKSSSLLTKREEGVVQLVAEGLTNRDISHQLNLSEHTVRNYLFRIFNKVGTSNRVELALYAIDRKDADSQPKSAALFA